MTQIPRLKKRRDFLKVASTRKKWVTPGLILQYNPRSRPMATLYATEGPVLEEGQPDIRIGFTVSKKVGNAPQRSRAKRRLRSLADFVILRQARSGFDLVLIGRKETLTRSFADLHKDLVTALWRTGIHRDADPKGERPPKAALLYKPNGD